MQSEDFDKKIRDAAEHHHPAYNEMAWSKMVHLLDEHLPVKPDRRRRFLFLLLFLVLMGGTAWLMIEKPWQPAAIADSHNITGPEKQREKQAATQPGQTSLSGRDHVNEVGAEKLQHTTDPAPAGDQLSPAPENNDKKADERKLVATRPLNSLRNSPFQKDNLSNIPSRKKTVSDPVESQLTDLVDPTIQNKAGTGKNDVQQQTANRSALPLEQKLSIQPTGDKPSADSKGDPALNADIAQEQKIIDIQAEPKKQDRVAPDFPNPAQRKKAPGKSRNKGFSLSISAGPDISMVGMDKTGKLQPVFGAGISYSFGKRFSLRSGFYTASKIYTADRYDYKPDVLSPNFNYLEKIDADCRVYEIPLTLAWQFSQNKQENWFAALGLSSYLMKKERYDYLYKYPSGQTYTYTRNLEGENNHFFSVLALSAGYTRKLNPVFSLSAEPYLRLPLGGVGYGNMKLYSGGVLFTLGAKLKGRN